MINVNQIDYHVRNKNVLVFFVVWNRLLSQKLHELKDKIQDAVVNRVVEDFIDIVSPLKHFTEAVHVPEGT